MARFVKIDQSIPLLAKWLEAVPSETDGKSLSGVVLVIPSCPEEIIFLPVSSDVVGSRFVIRHNGQQTECLEKCLRSSVYADCLWLRRFVHNTPRAKVCLNRISSIYPLGFSFDFWSAEMMESKELFFFTRKLTSSDSRVLGRNLLRYGYMW